MSKSTSETKILAFQDLMKASFVQAPLGLVKFSAVLKKAVDAVPLHEGQKSEVIFRLCRGFSEPREYARINSFPITAMANDRTVEKAWLDYSRCILAKALSHVFNVSISKYKNLTAKRIFLSDLAEVSEVLHRSEWINDVEVGLGQEKREIYDVLMNRVRLLLKQKWTPDRELNKKLEEAETEFFDSVKKMEELTGFKKGDIGKYSEDPKITSFFDPWYSESGRTGWWGVEFYPIINIINIQPQYLYFDELRRGLVAREAARLFSPGPLDRIEWIYEQSDYCACRILEKTDEGEFWRFARHGIRQESKTKDWMGYYSRRESIVGENFVKEIFSRVNSIGRFRPHINDLEYQTIVDTLALKPRVVRLNDKELKILRMLPSDPRVSITAIAQRIGHTLPTTRRIVEELNEKVNLWFSVLVDVRSIGLSEYFALLRVSPGKEEQVINLIWEVPYCTRIHKVYGPMNVIVHFVIPFMTQEYLHRYCTQLRRFNLVEDFAICRVQRPYYNFNLRYYDTEKDGWDVRWDEWGLWLREFLYERGWYYVLYEEATKKEEPRIPVKIDKLDLQIINQLVLDSRQPFTEIGRKLGVTGVYVSQKTHKLINQGIVKLITGSYRIGLDEATLLVIDCDSDVAKALSVALNELPMWQGMAITGDIEGLIAMIFVPTGDIGQLFHVIDTYLVQKGAVKKCWLNLVGKWVGKRRPLRWLPIDLYSKGEGWTFEGDKYVEDIKKRLKFMKQ